VTGDGSSAKVHVATSRAVMSGRHNGPSGRLHVATHLPVHKLFSSVCRIIFFKEYRMNNGDEDEAEEETKEDN